MASYYVSSHVAARKSRVYSAISEDVRPTINNLHGTLCEHGKTLLH